MSGEWIPKAGTAFCGRPFESRRFPRQVLPLCKPLPRPLTRPTLHHASQVIEASVVECDIAKVRSRIDSISTKNSDEQETGGLLSKGEVVDSADDRSGEGAETYEGDVRGRCVGSA